MKRFLKIILCSILIINFTSCVEELDFQQAETLELTPALLVSLVNSTITQNQLVIGGSEINMPVTQTSFFTVLNNDETRDSLERLVLNFDINNEFNREFRIQFLFLDSSDNTTLSPIMLNVNPNQSDFKQEEEIILANNPNFTNTEKVRVRVELLPSTDGSIIDVNIPASLTFKSAGTLYFRI